MSVPRTSFVIPHRAEGDWLAWTVANIRRACPDAEVICIEDRPAIGVSYQRHQGIIKARGDVVIVMDAHMDLPDGLDRICEDWLAENPMDVCCFSCPGVHPDTRLPNLPSARFGANLFRLRDGRPFVSSWLNKPQREVPNILGGAYAMLKEHYMGRIGGIWRWHRAWGKSEQMLSITNWLVGGRNVCLFEHDVPHWFKAHFKGSRSRPFGLDTKLIEQNAWLIIYGLMDEASRRLLMWDMGLANAADSYQRKELDRLGAVKAVQKHIDLFGVRGFAEYAAKFLI